ncbi:MAG: hypothetical protein E6Z55_03155 [Peptoniphilus harei]|nr:hypothetical protein [Peptoniphilus harei]
MKKFLFGILFLILLVGGFFIYQFGSDYGLNFGGKKLEAKTYEEIKEDFEKDPKNISIEDAYLLAKNEDDEKYYRALYEAYKKEDKDLGLQYLYNEFVMNNNKKVYPILKEEAKSDVTFTATETPYLNIARNSVKEEAKIEDFTGFYDYIFSPKFYDSKTKDECVYSFKCFEFPEEPIDFTDDSYNWPKLKINFIDSNGVKSLGGSPIGYQAGHKNIFFKNFDGKTVLALSMTDFAPKMAMEGFIPVIEQVYIYKDYSMTSTLVIQGGWGTEYRSWGIGSYKPFGVMDEINYYKGEEEISKEEFEKNVVPTNKLINLSKKESKSWIKVSTNKMRGPNDSVNESIRNNLILYTYNISLSQDVDLPYLRPYLKHIYTNQVDDFIMRNEDNNGNDLGKDFEAFITDLDHDGYPEIIMNYGFNFYSLNMREYHTKIIAYDPEKKSTYSLGDFISYGFDYGGYDFCSGGVYRKDGKNYFVIASESGGSSDIEHLLALYEKEGNNLKYIDSTIKMDDAYEERIIFYPTKKTINKMGDYYSWLAKDGIATNFTWPIPNENSKEKFESYAKEILNDSFAKSYIDQDYEEPVDYSETLVKGISITDIDEIKDILLANKMLSLPSYKRLAIGEKYYPKEVILTQDGKTYLDMNVLKDIKGLKVNKDEANILEKDNKKYLDLQDLTKLDLVTSENQDLVRLKENL